MYDANFNSSQPPLSAKPRRVRGGVRLVAREWPLALGWAGRAWMDSVSERAGEEALLEGFQYARGGQTRTLSIDHGRILASVQGRALRAYRVTIDVPVFSDEQWEAVVAAMSDQAIFGAKLLAGEMPESVGELFAGLEMRLFPGPDELRCACSAPDDTGWCKHACCAAILVAEAMEKEPFNIFTLRGLTSAFLLERLRERRAETGAGSAAGGASALTGVAATEAAPSRPLETCVEDFWEAGPALDRFETPLRRPEVSHALLRRLGPSPFPEGRFPLVGLLATCYDTVSQAALQVAPDAAPPPEEADPAPTPGTAEQQEPQAASIQTRGSSTGPWPLGTAKRKSG